MPNISLTYGEIEEAAAAMKASNRDVLTPAATAARRAFDDAVTEHLAMPETVPVLEQRFSEFYTQLTTLCDSVDAFADQFLAIRDGMADMDAQMASNILNPPQ